MPVERTWHLLPHDPSAIERLARGLNASPVVAQLLLNRGLEDVERARRFLDSPLNGLHPPALLTGVSEAAERLLAAARAGKHLCVYGDYDVDGTTGTAILIQALRLVGATQVDFYVPNRLEEGYGLNSEALRQIAASGAKTVVTVDCGICSLEEAEEAKRLGLELLITDHHEPREQLPAADVIVHPRLPGGSYPFGGLSGSAVAFKVAWALCQRATGGEKVAAHFKEFLVDSVALAALGTIADVVPLEDENRIFVRHGLNRLHKSPSVGLKALLEAAALHEKTDLKAADVGFRIAPRLNAVGRLGCARLVVELLTTSSRERAVDLARYLEKQNEQRQNLERRIFAQAKEQVEEAGLEEAPALVLASKEWHAGVIGIVAGRLVESFGRPTLLIALRDPDSEGRVVGQGSGRSVAGFPLHEALRACDEHLLSHGGHHAAAGFRIHPDCIDAFRERFCAEAARYFPDGPPPPQLVLDAEVPLHALTVKLVKELDRLEPYGSQNRSPLFLAGGLQVVGEPKRCGQGERHLRFQVRQQNTALWTICFGMSDRLDELMSDGGRCSLAFTPQINEWQGRQSVQMQVRDLQAGAQTRLG